MKRIESLRYHSERLVISFAILNRNTYSCNEEHTSMLDCHAATKVIVKIVEKEITVRDSVRSTISRMNCVLVEIFW